MVQSYALSSRDGAVVGDGSWVVVRNETNMHHVAGVGEQGLFELDVQRAGSGAVLSDAAGLLNNPFALAGKQVAFRGAPPPELELAAPYVDVLRTFLNESSNLTHAPQFYTRTVQELGSFQVASGE